VKKSQVGISGGIGIITIIIILVVLFNSVEETIEVEDLIGEKIRVEENVLPEIQEKLDKIKKNNLENSYISKDREWITSGPFQLDRSEYVLGEKIFMRSDGIQPNEKGQVAFMRPLNDTHYSVYLTIAFDGMNKGGFNYYLQPVLSKSKGTCSIDDILGEWTIVFRGTQYSNLKFNIINQTIPGDENDYDEPVCQRN
jgi:hypothetical protein